MVIKSKFFNIMYVIRSWLKFLTTSQMYRGGGFVPGAICGNSKGPMPPPPSQDSAKGPRNAPGSSKVVGGEGCCLKGDVVVEGDCGEEFGEWAELVGIESKLALESKRYSGSITPKTRGEKKVKGSLGGDN